MLELLSKDELDSVRKAGVILKDCLEFLSKEAKEGVSTKLLDSKTEEFIRSRGARPAFLGYKGFPASVCTSINEVVVHGIPSEKDILKNGDILSVDVGVKCNGYFADGAKTFAIGNISEIAKKVISVTRDALYKGIEKAIDGNHVQDISCAVESLVEARGFNVVRVFVGHGIGRKIHDEPEIPNFGRPHKGMRLEEGMLLAIEPMVNVGTSDVEILKDGWTAVTKDRKLSAHFEHTVLVKKDKAEILT